MSDAPQFTDIERAATLTATHELSLLETVVTHAPISTWARVRALKGIAAVRAGLVYRRRRMGLPWSDQ